MAMSKVKVHDGTVSVVQADRWLSSQYASEVERLLAKAARKGQILHVSLREISADMSRGDAFVALHSEGFLVGYQSRGLWPSEQIWEPRSKVVLPEYRRAGIGTALSKAILGHMSKKYPDWLALAFASGQSASIWRRLKFVDVTHDGLPDCLFTACTRCGKLSQALARGERCCAPVLAWSGNRRGRELIARYEK